MKVLITGANGFIGKNLRQKLNELNQISIFTFTRDDKIEDLTNLINKVDFIFHLAGINRALLEDEYEQGNYLLTEFICKAIKDTGRYVPIIFTSSTQVSQNTSYGVTKLKAENELMKLKKQIDLPLYIFRLPNIFGKWCLPNYNSVVATFCFNVARNLPIQVHDPKSVIKLVHIDDVIDRFIKIMYSGHSIVDSDGFEIISPQYVTSIGTLAEQITSFKESRQNLNTERVGAGLTRALYSTYVSYLPPDKFSYDLPQYTDSRGTFVEMLKTPDCGQFSYFIANVGVTRGGHYHHSKTEKFLVISGRALFRFINILTNEKIEIISCGGNAKVVETIPGWAHDITNIGIDDLIVMLWANEIFDRSNPDTLNYVIQ